MSSVGGVTGPAQAQAGIPAEQSASADSVKGQHSQFGNVVISKGAGDASKLEEMSIFVQGNKKFESKDQKKDKDIQKQLEKLKETVPDMPGMEKMDKFLQQLQDAKKSGGPTEDQIREFAQEYSGDPSHQYLGLDALIEHLQAQGDEELADRLKDYNDRFYSDNKKDIQSGINVSAAAAEFVEQSGQGNVQELRDTWRQALDVPDITTALEAYNYAKEKHGQNEVERGIEWLRQALATELQAMTTSVSPEHLTHVRQRLEIVFGLMTTVETSKKNEQVVIKMLQAASNG